MIKYENQCCNCATDGYPCAGSLCSLREVPVYYCDHCNQEIPNDEIYEVYGEHFHEDCMLDKFKKIF